MFCKKCGEQLKEGAKFCAVCGNPVQAPQAQPARPINNMPPAQAVSPQQSPQQAAQRVQAQPMSQGQQAQPQKPVQSQVQAATPMQNRQSAPQPQMQPQAQPQVQPQMQAQGAAAQQPHFVTYPQNWVGSLAMLPNFKMCMTKKYAKFSGRATRAEYFRYGIAASVIILILNIIISLVFQTL